MLNPFTDRLHGKSVWACSGRLSRTVELTRQKFRFRYTPSNTPQVGHRVLLVAVLLAFVGGCGGAGSLAKLPFVDRQQPQEVNAGTQPLPVEVSAQVKATYDAALQEIRASNRAAAKTLLEEVTSAQPNLAGPWINLARLQIGDEDYVSARASLDRALAANPSSCVAYNEYGVLLRKLGEFAAAQEKYQACLNTSPEHADTYFNLGILYELYLGRLEDALAAYRHYLEFSDDPQPRVQGWVADLERRIES